MKWKGFCFGLTKTPDNVKLDMNFESLLFSINADLVEVIIVDKQMYTQTLD